MRRMFGYKMGLPIVTMLGASLSFAGPPPSTPELVAQGKTSYTTNCATCHGDKGDGNGPAGAVLNPKPRDLRVKDEKVGGHYKQGGKTQDLFDTITKGVPSTTMVPFGHIPENDRWAIVYYVQQELQKGSAPAAKPKK